MKRVSFLCVLLLSVAGCSGPGMLPGPTAAEPVFAPLAFFSGRTVGNGVLRVALSRPRAVHVTGDGHVDGTGVLVLVQRVEEAGRPPRTRTWHLRTAGKDRFAGTLSDAKGPVRAEVRGNLLHLSFTAKGNLGIEQWLYLQPDGQTALNRMAVSKFGIRVAVLRETIRHAP